jgi:hypothetical protein
MRPRTAYPAVALAGMLFLAACGEDEPSTSATDPETSMTQPDETDPTTPESEPPPSTDSPDTSADPTDPPGSDPSAGQPWSNDPQAQSAIDDLAQRVGVDPTAIEVTAYQSVTWRDGSLGCPQPDMLYTMALVPGRRMVLTVDGKDYAYHADRTSDFRYCAKPAADPTVPGDT